MNIKKVYPLNTPEEIRTALRKSTVQTAIYKNQAESGRRRTTELLAYIGFMTEDECVAFLNSVRAAPFLPNVNLMWTKQVAEYLMLSAYEVLRRNINLKITNIDEIIDQSETGKIHGVYYMREHVPEESWGLLPQRGSAKYFSPSEVLRIAVKFENSSEICKHIAEKLFIKAADLEDCLQPVTAIPPALPELSKTEKVKRKKNEVILRDFPEGTHIAIDIPKSEQQVIPNVVEIPKAAKVRRVRNNPIAEIAPAYASGEDVPHDHKMTSEEINAYIKEHFTGFGGNETTAQISQHVGMSKVAVRSRIHKIRVKFGIPVDSGNNIDSDKKTKAIEVIKARSTWFGGKDGVVVLSKELGMSYGALYRLRNRIQASMPAGTN